MAGHRFTTTTTVTLLGALALTALGAPVALGGEPAPCRVRS